MRLALALLILPALVQCAPAGPPASGQAEAAGAVECIDLSRVASRHATGPDSLYFEMLGGKAWRNQLGGRCPGLEHSENFGALAFEPSGNSLCRGDKVRAVDPARGGYGSSVPCLLGRFVPAPKEARDRR